MFPSTVVVVVVMFVSAVKLFTIVTLDIGLLSNSVNTKKVTFVVSRIDRPSCVVRIVDVRNVHFIVEVPRKKIICHRKLGMHRSDVSPPSGYCACISSENI